MTLVCALVTCDERLSLSPISHKHTVIMLWLSKLQIINCGKKIDRNVLLKVWDAQYWIFSVQKKKKKSFPRINRCTINSPRFAQQITHTLWGKTNKRRCLNCCCFKTCQGDQIKFSSQLKLTTSLCHTVLCFVFSLYPYAGGVLTREKKKALMCEISAKTCDPVDQLRGHTFPLQPT